MLPNNCRTTCLKKNKIDMTKPTFVWLQNGENYPIANVNNVGAIIVKDRNVISDGYNGTPTGFENYCEDEEDYTKWYVLHAESQCHP